MNAKEKKVRLVVRPPDADSPGFLRLMKSGLELREGVRKMQEDKISDPALIDQMINFMLPYIAEPKDRERAYDLLLDASENEINTVMDAIVGSDEENPTESASKEGGAH